MHPRRRSIPHTFEDRIAAEKAKLEAQLAKLKPGPEMDALRRKIGQLETASHISEGLSSPGLQTPHDRSFSGVGSLFERYSERMSSASLTHSGRTANAATKGG